jgi:hypothetical protein
MKKPLVIGASPNPERLCQQSSAALAGDGHEIELLGLRPGEIFL